MERRFIRILIIDIKTIKPLERSGGYSLLNNSKIRFISVSTFTVESVTSAFYKN